MDTAPQSPEISKASSHPDTAVAAAAVGSFPSNTSKKAAVQSADSAAVYKPVKALDAETARKIAAGEVIDRPAAVIRELLDNAIDAGASKVQVEISGGGIDRIRVTDNGCGMSREDLAICTDTHTTSKISTAEDLLSLHSLGFRGEALSSIKAVSDLEITSTRNGPAAWKLQLGKILPARLNAGTVVQVENLFENFPARKQFLKRAAAETALCRTIFLDKSLPHYTTEMRFVTDGMLRFLLAPVKSLRERCLAAFSFKEPEALFFEIEGGGEHFSFRIVLGSPDVVRSDKRAIMVFVNGRRITEFGLTQAIEYGSEGYFPNGGHPVAFLFLTVEPSRVDFNIHPAKKEARFQDYGAIHHVVSSAVGSFYRQHTVASLLKEKYEPSLTRPLDFQYGGAGQAMDKSNGFVNNGLGDGASRQIGSDNSQDNFSQGSRQPDAVPYSAWGEQNRLYAESLAQKHGSPAGAYPQPLHSGTTAGQYGYGESGSPAAGTAVDDYDQYGKAHGNDTGTPAAEYGYGSGLSGTQAEYGTAQSGYGSAFRQIAATAAVSYSASGHIIPPPAATGMAAYLQPPPDLPPADFKLLGQVAGTFIAVEKNDALYLIDQHAAHERIIFEQLRRNTGGVQELLIPYRIITSSEEDDAFIKKHQELLCKAGFALSDEGAGVWQVTAVPARWTGTERDLIRDITGVRKNAGDILYQVLASAACRAACKDHAILDPVTQQRIAAQAFELPEPICPHGRPIWIVFTREELFKRVKRT
ncbi:DNA mismatch repair endonuclease MutL [Treponema medium]|uniref:DNA mismatch repair endonuclease MutL n=1 Tax=Treponema medium TaxID=58231 RepID=UPI00197D014E|nr:DNA mismatch repair endonuclease MutL [Treponema medium]QSH91356.1 DNA mismatch repair endonuclease MutL [Treponema medium]